jgi:hypothetical protein
MTDDARSPKDVRLPIAVAGFLLLAGVVLVVILGGEPGRGEPRAIPAWCVSLWNGNTNALRAGYHNFHSHSYTRAEVLRLDRVGNPRRRGRCAVVFPAVTLDVEPAAAVKVYRGGRWSPLSESPSVSRVRLSELQAEAIDTANVDIRPDGTLAVAP